NHWYHIAAVKDIRKTSIFVDGKMERQIINDRTVNSDQANVLIGRRLSGRMQEVEFFNRALTADEVAGLAGRRPVQARSRTSVAVGAFGPGWASTWARKV